MHRTVFDQRRPALPVAGLPRDLVGLPVRDPRFAALLADPAVRRRLEEDPVPIPHPEDREGYYEEHHLDYWASGHDDFVRLRPLFDVSPRPALYLDLGGATGRVVRHVRQEPGVEPWLVDISAAWIDWVREHFPGDVKAFQARVHPTLPFEDRTFSVISAFSVFTHFDNDELPWLLELRRILKPGGHLYLTTADEGVWELLREPDWAWLRRAIARGRDEERFTRLVAEPMPGRRFVWTYSDADSYNVNTFLHSEHVKNVWGGFLELVDYRPRGHGFQTVVILRKR